MGSKASYVAENIIQVLSWQLRDAEVFRITQTAFAPLNQKANLELVQEVGKLLACGRFYFSYPSTGVGFNILTCAQQQGKATEEMQFFW